MKLQVKLCTRVHKEMVAAIAWTPENELYSISDDKTVHRWDMAGEPIGRVTALEAYGTTLSWFPAVGKQTSDVFALGCSDGTVRLITRAGREEKKVDSAHTGAVIRVAWAYDGSALASCGEDGDVKVWSRGGNLRSTLLQTGTPVYALAWSPDNEQVTCCLYMYSLVSVTLLD
jgi:intraflagellar transport protein 80